MRNGAPTIVPMVCRGFSDEYGSWKMIWMSRRSGRIAPREKSVIVAAVEDDLAGRRLEQLGDHPPGRGLAAAGLADQAQRLAGLDVEVHAVDGLDRADLALQHALADREVLLQPAHRQQRLGVSRVAAGADGRSRRSRDWSQSRRNRLGPDLLALVMGDVAAGSVAVGRGRAVRDARSCTGRPRRGPGSGSAG